jgi:hypothetical protein
MRLFILGIALSVIYTTSAQQQTTEKATVIFDGKTFKGWEGDTVGTWKIVDGALAGGSLNKTVEHNQFLSTIEEFGDFEVMMEVKLVGTTGVVNGGVQFHSQRLQSPAYEMTGYQADLANGLWGSLYDESRRNVTIVRPESAAIEKVVKRNDWNNFTIRSVGRRIQIWLNGMQTVDYTEPDAKIPHHGRLAVQIHGGGKAVAFYKNIRIKRL